MIKNVYRSEANDHSIWLVILGRLRGTINKIYKIYLQHKTLFQSARLAAGGRKVWVGDEESPSHQAVRSPTPVAMIQKHLPQESLATIPSFILILLATSQLIRNTVAIVKIRSGTVS